MNGEQPVTPDAATLPAQERRGIRKGLFLIPSAFTAANIGMGYFAVMGALRGFQLVEGGTEAELLQATSHFDNAARAIGWAVVFDALDGRIARLTKTTTEIGVQLDSIADVVTFGIAPAVLLTPGRWFGLRTGKQCAQVRLVPLLYVSHLRSLQAGALQRASESPARAG